jgi:hypothetical protein
MGWCEAGRKSSFKLDREEGAELLFSKDFKLLTEVLTRRGSR